jgi:membrane-associated phospholipid phosphatase
VVLGRVHPPARPALYAFAGAICACRPYLGMHYPSDVIAGMTLGAFVGKVFPLPPERTKEPTGPIAAAVPAAPTAGAGVEAR